MKEPPAGDLRTGRYPQELVDAATSLVKLVAEAEGFEATMARTAQLAVAAIHGATECSISLARPNDRDIQTIAATTDAARKTDQLQTETGEGPCMSSMESHATFHIHAMERDETWPTFSRRAVKESGVKSMVCFVLRLADEEFGALNLMSTSSDAFPEDDIDTGTLFAALVAVALGTALKQERERIEAGQLREAIKTRQVIGQAVGIVMATRHVDAEEAFHILVRISQNSNVKLREIAQNLVDKADEV